MRDLLRKDGRRRAAALQPWRTLLRLCEQVVPAECHLPLLSQGSDRVRERCVEVLAGDKTGTNKRQRDGLHKGDGDVERGKIQAPRKHEVRSVTCCGRSLV